MVDVTKVAFNIYMIDNLLYSIPRFGSTYLLNEEKKALVDFGPTTSAPVVIEGLKQLGLKPEDIDYLIATHIHLDHAGGAGYLLQKMPKAKLVLHPRGVKHLVDPSNLVASVKQAMGEDGIKLSGDVIPVPESRIIVMKDGDTLALGERQVLTFIDAPGHAPHQFCICESRHGGLFAADAVGNYEAKSGVLLPITPPPSFDYDMYVATLHKLMAREPKLIYFSHFGMVKDAKKYMEKALTNVQERKRVCDRAFAEGKIDEALEQIIKAECADVQPLQADLKQLYEFWCNGSIRTSAEGFVKNYRERMQNM